MADNEPITEVEGMPSVTEKTTAEIEAIVDRRLAAQLKKLDYMTSKQVTELLDKQTLTFQSAVSGLREELAEQIKSIRGDFTDEMKEWRSTIRDLDNLTRQVLNQNIQALQLSSEIKGQNSAITDTLNRFSNRLDDIGDDVDTKLKASLSDFHNMVTVLVTANSDRITALEQNDQRRNAVEARLRSVPQTLWAAVKFVSSPRMLAVIAAIGTLTGISFTAVVEFLKVLGGG